MCPTGPRFLYCDKPSPVAAHPIVCAPPPVGALLPTPFSVCPVPPAGSDERPEPLPPGPFPKGPSPGMGVQRYPSKWRQFMILFMCAANRCWRGRQLRNSAKDGTESIQFWRSALHRQVVTSRIGKQRSSQHKAGFKLVSIGAARAIACISQCSPDLPGALSFQKRCFTEVKQQLILE